MMWLVFTVLLTMPLVIAALWMGGIPPSTKGDDNEQYWKAQDWTGSPEQGRAWAIGLFIGFGLLFAVVAVWMGAKFRQERIEVQRIDTTRIAEGVPVMQPARVQRAETHPVEVPIIQPRIRKPSQKLSPPPGSGP